MNLSPARLLAGLFLLALSTVPVAADSLRAYREGRGALDQRRWDRAVRFFEKAIASNDQEGGEVRLRSVDIELYLPYFYLGVALFELGRFDEALRAWKISSRQGAIERTAQAGALAYYRAQAEERLALQGSPASPERPAAAPPDVLEPTSAEMFGLTESYALVVGASRYRGAWQPLPGVVEDVVHVEAALARLGFKVRVLSDPTKEELVRAMEDFFFTTPRTEASRLVFYYAGHGYTLPEENSTRGYIVPVDTPLYQVDPGGFLRHAISMARFHEYARETLARHAILLFDSCFSGSIFEVSRSSRLPGSVREKVGESSRVFIAAGASDQVVPDQSYFRRAFVEGLNGAGDVNGDGFIFGGELGAFIRDRVIDRFYATDRPQTPRYGWSADHARGDFPFRAPRAR